MSTTFHHPINNVAANVSAPRAAGVASVTVSDGSPFGTTFPLIVTATRAGAVLAILEVTGRDGNVLTVSGAIEGTADVALQAGDRLEMRPTALAITELQAAVLSDEADLATHVADTSNPHGVTAAQVGAASAQWNASTLQGVAVATAAPDDGQALVYSATAGAWVPQAVATGGGLAIGGPVAGGTSGRVLYEAAGPVVADSADLVFDAVAKRLGIGVAAPGATLDLGLAGTLKAGVVSVDYNGPLGGPDTTWPDGSNFRQCVSPVLGSNDLLFQGLANAGAYFYLEDWQGLGLVLGTGNADQPILLRPARTTVATVDSSGTILRVVAPSAADVPLAFQAAAGQTADLLQVQDATGAVLSRIDAAGGLHGDGSGLTGLTATNGVVTTGSYADPAWITALAPSKVAVFSAAGPSHATGTVPDPGATAGTARYLREDATWDVPPGGSGGMAIGSAVASGTAGSVLFVDTSNHLAQDNAGLFWDEPNKALGVGNPNPGNFGALAVQTSGTTVVNISTTATLGSGGRVIMQFVDGTGNGYDFGATSTTSDVFGIRVLQNGVFTPFTIDPLANIALGLASPATTATTGFVYLPTMAGTPTGVPGAKTGLSPVLIDSTNKKFWAYLGGSWVGTDLT